MLVSKREDWQHGFRVIDTKNAHYYDKNGSKTDYDALLAAAPQAPTPWSRPRRWVNATTLPRQPWTTWANASETPGSMCC